MKQTSASRVLNAKIGFRCLLGGFLFLLLPGIAATVQGAPAAKIQFNRDIRPILSDNCYKCHGPDKNNRQANLRLDMRPSALDSGALKPGKPENSKLVARILANDGSQMPPLTAHKSLTKTQKDLLVQWVKEGGEYEAHWSYLPPQRPPVPVISDTRYPVHNPIDSFVFSLLQQKRILPSPQADRRTLIRRVTLDLTGLPPAPKETQAFLADSSPSAYERVVDRLLASPSYGERMAVPWLDLVRYADTVGFHGDQNQNAWPYRDYVISAFQQNMPFDQFTREQIAGDLIPFPTPLSRTATCFNRLNMVTREGGAQPKEYLAKYMADRVRTVGMTWLGSTLACCECHDHKYDPFTQKDFYSLGAFFADMQQWGVYADYGYTPNPDLRGYNNDYPFPPEITIASSYLFERINRDRWKMQRTAEATEAILKRDPAANAAFDAWRKQEADFLIRHPDGWETLTPMEATAMEATAMETPPKKPAADRASQPPPPRTSALQIDPDGSVLVTGKGAQNVTLLSKLASGWISILRVELLPHAVNGGSVFRTGMNAATVSLTASIRHANGKVQPLVFRFADADFSQPMYSNGFALVGVQRGWKLDPNHAGEINRSEWILDTPILTEPDDTLTVTFPGCQAGCIRLSATPFEAEDLSDPMVRASLLTYFRNPAIPNANQGIMQAYLAGTGWNSEAYLQYKRLEADLFACRKGQTPVMVTAAIATPLTMRVLPRGNWQDEGGEIVQPAPPHFLPHTEPPAGQRLTRLDLANWLTSQDNPLTARVFVNRLWKQFFGTGLSAQLEDVGAQGEWPTHPELLDWMAVEFMKPFYGIQPGHTVRVQPHRGWDIKHMVRLIVTSSTYQQSSKLRPELHESDPNNRLLASQNPRRLEAEFVRDNALAIAGLLNTDIGGPPCKPYQPTGYYANIQFPDRNYIADADDREWRRGLYMHWQRTFLHPMLANFDAPSREDCIAARNVSNTPQQALTLLNDPTFVEAARAFALRILQEPVKGDSERLERAYQIALGRSLQPKERDSLLAFLKQVRTAYLQQPADADRLLKIGIAPVPPGTGPVELAAWTNLCRVVLNLQETITRY